MNQKLYPRWQFSEIKAMLQERRVLALVGARQSGKTTLAEELIAIGAIYRTLDDITLLEAAREDPQGFVHHGDELMIIDEVQRAPALLQAIKREVDQNKKVGRFLLAGSANIQALPGVNESLAGRISKIRLRTLTQAEVHGVDSHFLKRIFKLNINLQQKSTYNKQAYLELALQGGYPEAIMFTNIKQSHRWHRDYLDALLERDLQDIANIRRQQSIHELMYVLSAWSSKFIDISAIGSGLSITRETINTYINALEALYIIERLKPWSKTDYDRVSKQDKLFVSDTGLMSAVLGWQLQDVELNSDKNGKLLETFVHNQLAALVDTHQGILKMYHYRDREKREIDFIIENDGGDLMGIEVKAGSALTKSTFKHLIWFKENIAKTNNFIGVVFYTGEMPVSFGENLYALPISFLWEGK